MVNPRVTAPPVGVVCRIKSSDYMGEYHINGIRKDYKQKPSVSCFNDGGVFWRFVDSAGEKIPCCDIESWEISTTNKGKQEKQ